jgi:hypothetical protein
MTFDLFEEKNSIMKENSKNDDGKRWRRRYGIVLISLVAYILLFYLFTRTFQ